MMPGQAPNQAQRNVPFAKQRFDGFIDQLKQRLDSVKSAAGTPKENIEKLRGLLKGELEKLDKAAQFMDQAPRARQPQAEPPRRDAGQDMRDGRDDRDGRDGRADRGGERQGFRGRGGRR